jgi:hypothetical protein
MSYAHHHDRRAFKAIMCSLNFKVLEYDLSRLRATGGLELKPCPISGMHTYVREI